MRVWFDRNVSGTYQLVHHLRANADGMPVTVVGTYPRPDHLLLQACDEAALEPVLPDDEHVAWALDFAVEHGIDVYVPGEQRQLAVARSLDRFAAAGVRVMVSPPEVVALLQDKAATYVAARAAGIPVAEFRVVRTGSELRSAYDELRALGHAVTLKPVTGFGGSGFWKLSEDRPDLQTLLGLPEGRMHVDDAAALLDRADPEEVPPLMVSQYLSSPEDSVDVLAHQGRVLASVIRRKPSLGQSRSFPVDEELTALTERVVAHFGPAYLCNVQWRRVEGRPVLLEVNTRAASGLAQSCESGVNFPYLALRLVLGLPVTVPAVRAVPDQVTYTDAVVMRALRAPRARRG